ncbi:MAG: hypothetical protein V5A49_10605 [Haloarcula sp.]
MSYRTTLGWSLVTSGLVTLFLWALPGSDLLWGVLLLALGGLTLYVRQ